MADLAEVSATEAINKPMLSGISANRKKNGGGKDESIQCYINSGAIVLFSSTASEQKQQDVLYSLLFAQLAADKRNNRQMYPQDWFDYFSYVLQNIGWVLTNTSYEVQVSDTVFVTSSLALKQMARNGTSDENIENFRRVLNLLHDLPESDTSVELLYDNTYNRSTFATNVILVSPEISLKGELKFNLIMIAFKPLREVASRYLFHIYSTKNVTFDKARASEMVLNEAIFEKARAMIVEKLGDKVKTMISEIKISI